MVKSKRKASWKYVNRASIKLIKFLILFLAVLRLIAKKRGALKPFAHAHCFSFNHICYGRNPSMFGRDTSRSLGGAVAKVVSVRIELRAADFWKRTLWNNPTEEWYLGTRLLLLISSISWKRWHHQSNRMTAARQVIIDKVFFPVFPLIKKEQFSLVTRSTFFRY